MISEIFLHKPKHYLVDLYRKYVDFEWLHLTGAGVAPEADFPKKGKSLIFDDGTEQVYLTSLSDGTANVEVITYDQEGSLESYVRHLWNPNPVPDSEDLSVPMIFSRKPEFPLPGGIYVDETGIYAQDGTLLLNAN